MPANNDEPDTEADTEAGAPVFDAAFRDKLEQLQPDPAARRWLEAGGTSRDN